MFHLILAIASSALVSLGMRLSESRVTKNNLGMLAVNYVLCSLLGGGYMLSGGQALSSGLGVPLGLGVISGALYLVSLMLLQWNVAQNGVTLAATFMKLGVLVPTLLSILFFGEHLGLFQALGVAAAVAAIVMMNMEKSEGRAKNMAGLLLLLLGGGMADAMSKVFEGIGTASGNDLFLFATFASALVFCLALMMKKGQRIGKNELLFGCVVGLPNYFSARFLLASLSSVPAVIAYPTYSVATLVVISVVGVVGFRERLSRMQVLALLLILLALAMLNL